MFGLPEEKARWIGRDAQGRLCTFRKVHKVHRHEREVLEVCTDELMGLEGLGLIDKPRPHVYKHKTNHHFHEHNHLHHHFHEKPAPHSPCPVRFAPVPDIPPQFEVRHPRHRSPSGDPCIPCSPPFRELLGRSPPPAAARRQPPSPKIYRVVDPHLKLERVPLREIYHAGEPVARLEKVKRERIRPERADDFDMPPRHHDRGRARYRDHQEERRRGEDHQYPRVRMPRQLSYSRHRDLEERQEERAVWDEELEAFVIRRAPSVRFV